MKQALWVIALIVLCLFEDAAYCQETIPTTPEDIIRKAVDAHGGQKALAKGLTYRSRAKGLIYNGDKSAPMTLVYLYRYPNHTKLIGEVRSPDGLMTTINVFNGKKAWTKRNRITVEGNDKGVQEARMAAYIVYVDLLYPLLDRDRFKLTVLPGIKVKDKDTAGVRVSSKGYSDICLYFDTQTWLHVKNEIGSEKRVRNGGLFEEVYFEEYKLLKDHVKHATKRTTVINGKKRLEAELVDIVHLDKIDDSEFTKP